jgi:hypothetical protein
MDRIIDAVTEGAVWGLACGAAMLLIKPVRRGIRPTVRRVVASGVAATNMVGDATRKGRTALREVYSEAVAETREPKREHGQNPAEVA